MELKDSFSGWSTNVYTLEKDSVLHFSTVLKTGEGTGGQTIRLDFTIKVNT